MMTPIMYLWNPYNVEIVMDSHESNQGAYQFFYAPPDLEFTFDNLNWISLKSYKTFQFGRGAELFAMWSSNNEKNRLTNGEGVEIPAGEFRYNCVIPPPDSFDINSDPYIRMQFFDKYGISYRKLFGNGDSAVQGFPNNFSPFLANWVESTDDSEDYNRVFTGVFSPVINYTQDTGAGLTSNGEPKKDNPRIKKIVGEDTLLNFGLRLKNQFFASRLGLGGGWNSTNPNYDPGAGLPIHEVRMIGALNIDTNSDTNSFKSRAYHSSESDIIPVGFSDLPDILDANNRFKGIEEAKKIALNVDIRGFQKKTPQGNMLSLSTLQIIIIMIMNPMILHYLLLLFAST